MSSYRGKAILVHDPVCGHDGRGLRYFVYASAGRLEVDHLLFAGRCLWCYIWVRTGRTYFNPPYAKMYFVCWAGSFAASFCFLNRIHGRKVYLVVDPKHLPEIWAMGDLTPYWQLNLLLNWKAMILLGAGFIGGIFTSIAGSGIDICSFSVLTLLFRVSEKTATPTSVVLMAINTFLAMCYCKWMMREGLEQLAWEFFASARLSSW